MTDSHAPSARRLLLTGAAAALAGGAVLASTDTAEAADGQAVLAGRANTATQATYLTSSTTARGLSVTTTNAATSAHAVGAFAKGGAGIHAESTTGHGALLRTKNPKTWGAWVANQGTAKGGGGALRADGGPNPGILATTTEVSSPAILVRNLSPQASEVGRGVVSLVGVAEKPPEVGPGAGEFVGPNGICAYGTGKYGRGVTGMAGTGGGAGVEGKALDAESVGVAAHSWGGTALLASGPSQLLGNVHVAGTLSKQAGSFKIDHPLDPANKYLYHSFVESPDMKNVYDGVVVADPSGSAVVELPKWFEALNSDFRYQLTPIGRPREQVYVSAEISGGSFSLAGANPGQRISWQVTGIRRDTYARDHRIPVEQDKPAGERGTYLHPTGAGKPESASLAAALQARLNPKGTHR